MKSFVLFCLVLGANTLSAQVKVKIAPSIKQEVQKDGSLVLRSVKPMKVLVEGQKEPVLIGTIASLSCACGDLEAGTCSRTDVGCVGSCCGLNIGYHDSMLKVSSGGIFITPDDVEDLKKHKR